MSGPAEPTVVIAEPLHYAPEARSILASLGPVVEGPFDRTGLLAAVGSARVLVVRLAHQVDDEVLAAGPHLEAIASPTTGTDHIDVEAAEARGIRVVTLKGETEFLSTVRATPEHTWALLLALARHLPAAAASVAAGEWDRDAHRGTELAGKRLGILGLGRVGRLVAAYGNAFGMEVLGHDLVPAPAPEGVTIVPALADLLRQSDVLLVHVPLDDTTRHVVGAAELALLPPGALLVNTSRGAVLDERAVVDALERGHLGGVAVDVVEDERAVDGHRRSPLVAYARDRPDRAIVTPHIAGATWESMHRTEVFLAQRLQALITAGA